MKKISVVLANLMSSSCILNQESQSRLDLAAHDDLNVPSDCILLCGWAYRPDVTLSIADVMYTYISNIYPSLRAKAKCQRYSRDTVGDAVLSRIFIEKMYVLAECQVTVFTSDYHLVRSLEIFRFVFGSHCHVFAQGAKSYSSNHTLAEQTSLLAFRKTFSSVAEGDLCSIYSTLIQSHPFYNGDVYSCLMPLTEMVRRSTDHS